MSFWGIQGTQYTRRAKKIYLKIVLDVRVENAETRDYISSEAVYLHV